jgi:hypothetical protein
MEAMNLDFSDCICRLDYFEAGVHKIYDPDEKQISHALLQLQNEIDCVTRTVKLWRMSERNNTENNCWMQFQGERNKFLVVLMRGNYMLGRPAFDKILGERGIVEVIGDEWASNNICTDFSIVEKVALTFGISGRLAFPEIWTVFDNELSS